MQVEVAFKPNTLSSEECKMTLTCNIEYAVCVNIVNYKKEKSFMFACDGWHHLHFGLLSSLVHVKLMMCQLF